MLKFLTLTFLAACVIPLALADSPPTRTFVARAYQSPYPIGQQLSGAYLFAQNGSFYVATAEPAKKALISTDSSSKAYLDGKTPIYLNTVTGRLEYQDGNQKAAPGAVYILFLHFGQSNSSTIFSIPPSATFEWDGVQSNSYWFGCPVTGKTGILEIYKAIANIPFFNKCTVFQLAALDQN